MPKKTIASLLTALSPVLIKTPTQNGKVIASDINYQFQPALPEVQPEIPTAASDIHRIANALDRIASALEKLSAPEVIESPESSQEVEVNWITLVDSVPNHKVPVSPAPSLPAEEKQEVPAGGTNPPAKVAPLAIAPTQNSVLTQFLHERGITYRKPKKKVTAEMEKLAIHLGNHFAVCKGLYQELKRNLKAGKTINYSLQGFTFEDNHLVREFCQLLKGADLVEDFTYERKPEYKIQLTSKGKEQNFLTGTWLEIYVKSELDRIVSSFFGDNGQPYEARTNLNITFKDASKGELDLLFAVEGRIFCVETKTRPKTATLKSNLEHIKKTGVKNKNILIVVAQKTEEQCLQLGKTLGNVRVTSLDKLEEVFKSLLEFA